MDVYHTDLLSLTNGSRKSLQTFSRLLHTAYISRACGWYTEKSEASEIPTFKSKKHHRHYYYYYYYHISYTDRSFYCCALYI